MACSGMASGSRGRRWNVDLANSPRRPKVALPPGPGADFSPPKRQEPGEDSPCSVGRTWRSLLDREAAVRRGQDLHPYPQRLGLSGKALRNAEANCTWIDIEPLGGELLSISRAPWGFRGRERKTPSCSAYGYTSRPHLRPPPILPTRMGQGSNVGENAFHGRLPGEHSAGAFRTGGHPPNTRRRR